MSGETDFIARLADAWDGRGRNALRAPAEHNALLRLANIPADDFWSTRQWMLLPADMRERLVFAARLGVDLGRTCAWVFGAKA